MMFFCLIFSVKAQNDTALFKVIAFYSANWDDGHISYAHEANTWFPKMGAKYNFQYDSTNNWSNLNASYLSQYQVVLFLDNQPAPEQRAAFEEYIRNGGSWMGFHVVAFNQNPSAWDWYYNQFLGMGSYNNNTWAPTSAVLRVEDRTHPATKNLPETFVSSPNEWYSWTVDLRKKSNIKILCSIDSTSFPLGTGTGNGGASEIWHSGYYPVVWTNTDYHMMYLNMGHNLIDYSKNKATASWTFTNETQNKLVLDGLFWLASLNKPDPRRTKLRITSPANATSYKDPANIDINVNATDSDGVAKVEFYNGSAKLGEDLTSPYSYTWNNVALGDYNIIVKATDSLNNVTTTSISVSVQGEGAFNGKIAPIPGKIEVENYDYGGQGVGYNDAESSNQGGQYRVSDGVDIETCSDAGGGYSIGYTAAGEWLKYTVNVSQAGDYTLQARVASTNSGKFFHVEMDGVNISGKITVPSTGGWQTWKTVNVAAKGITTGQKEMKIIMDTDGYNLNYLNFTQQPLSINVINNNNLVYPNPSNGIVNIKLNQPLKTNTTLLIVDNIGREVKTLSYSNLSDKEEISFDFSGYKKGVYFLKFSTDETYFSKIVIM